MEKFDKIFQTTDCLSEETMKAWLNNELSAEDKHIVEQHLADCPMCADALEGLSYMKNPDQLGKYINLINAEVDARIRPKRRTLIYRIKPAYSIAAALILLFGIAYILKISFFDFKQDSAVAEQMIENTEKAKEPFDETLPVIEEEKEEHAESTEVEEDTDVRPEETGHNEDSKITESEERLAAENKTVPEAVSEPTVATDELEETTEEAADLTPTIKDLQSRLKKQAETEETTETSEEKKDEAVFFGNTRSHLESSEGGDEPKEKKLLSKRGNNTALIEKDYENAVKLYKADKLKDAAKIFDRIMVNGGLHQYDAMWFRALIYKANNNPDKAIELFEKVAESKTKFSKQAAKELENR
jgi:TolA-binding protein